MLLPYRRREKAASIFSGERQMKYELDVTKWPYLWGHGQHNEVARPRQIFVPAVYLLQVVTDKFALVRQSSRQLGPSGKSSHAIFVPDLWAAHVSDSLLVRERYFQSVLLQDQCLVAEVLETCQRFFEGEPLVLRNRLQ